jgi:ABC-type multidrug transport system fused ATPase/permease subunit
MPTSGEVFIDDIPVQNYDIHQLRRSIAFLAQSEDIYPISLRENILMGHPDYMKSPSKNQILVDEAAHLGGSYGLITRLGYDTILNPPNVLGQSLGGCGNGEIGPLALEELKRHSSSFRETPISCGEKQRLLAYVISDFLSMASLNQNRRRSRTFMRLKNSDARLLVVDEPASALDPIAERDLFNRFLELRKGRTTIFVTHRFGNVVKQADLILSVHCFEIVMTDPIPI